MSQTPQQGVDNLRIRYAYIALRCSMSPHGSFCGDIEHCSKAHKVSATSQLGTPNAGTPTLHKVGVRKPLWRH